MSKEMKRSLQNLHPVFANDGVVALHLGNYSDAIGSIHCTLVL